MPRPQPANCPQCGHATAKSGFQQIAWCPACEWNLLAYAPRRRPPPGWRLVERLSHRLAVRLDRSLAAELSGNLPRRPTITVRQVVLLVLSAILLAAIGATFCYGLWLVGHDPAPVRSGTGILLVLLAVALRPRLYRDPKRAERLDRAKAPTLFALVERVAGRIGATPPDYIVLDEEFNASVRRTGFRRRTTLTLGLPLWVMLDGQARVALLAHELGHTVNGDPTRRLLVQPALSTFARLANLTRGDQSLGAVLNPGRPRRSVIEYGFVLTTWAISRVFLLAQLALMALAMRDHQRAEYLADHFGVEVGGTDGSLRLLNTTTSASALLRLLSDHAETEGPTRWLPLTEAYLSSRAGRLPRARQLSRRHTDLWRSHPPDGLRAAVIEAREHREPGLVVSDAATVQLDRELAAGYRSLHQKLLRTRIFRPRPAAEPVPRADGSPEVVVGAVLQRP